jgi:hypothetical protein
VLNPKLMGTIPLNLVPIDPSLRMTAAGLGRSGHSIITHHANSRAVRRSNVMEQSDLLIGLVQFSYPSRTEERMAE